MATLLGADALKLLKKYGIPVAKYKRVKSKKKAKRLKTPCVLKVPEISHKTEKDAVKVVHNRKNSVAAYRILSKKGDVFYQPFVEGREVVIGAKEDPAFGKVVMFGLGGVNVELYKDVSFRVIPLRKKDARAMISEIKASKLLGKFRGQKAVDKQLLIRTLRDVSRLAQKEDVKELDINPFIINHKSGRAVDARIVTN